MAENCDCAPKYNPKSLQDYAIMQSRKKRVIYSLAHN